MDKAKIEIVTTKEMKKRIKSTAKHYDLSVKDFLILSAFNDLEKVICGIDNNFYYCKECDYIVHGSQERKTCPKCNSSLSWISSAEVGDFIHDVQNNKEA